MRYTTVILSLSLQLFLTACAQRQEPVKIETATIMLPTIQCSMCVDKVEKALGTVEGITKASVDLEKKLAVVDFVPASVSLPVIETAIARAGYDANSKKADPEAYEKLPECCKVGE